MLTDSQLPNPAALTPFSSSCVLDCAGCGCALLLSFSSLRVRESWSPTNLRSAHATSLTQVRAAAICTTSEPVVRQTCGECGCALLLSFSRLQLFSSFLFILQTLQGFHNRYVALRWAWETTNALCIDNNVSQILFEGRHHVAIPLNTAFPLPYQYAHPSHLSCSRPSTSLLLGQHGLTFLSS